MGLLMSKVWGPPWLQVHVAKPCLQKQNSSYQVQTKEPRRSSCEVRNRAAGRSRLREEGRFQKGRKSGMLLRERETQGQEKTDLPLSQSKNEEEEEKRGSETRLEVVRKEEVQGRKNSWALHGTAIWPDHRESSRRRGLSRVTVATRCLSFLRPGSL